MIRLAVRDMTHIFLSLVDTGRDLVFGRESLVLGRVYLILAKHGKRCLDVELLDANLAG